MYDAHCVSVAGRSVWRPSTRPLNCPRSSTTTCVCSTPWWVCITGKNDSVYTVETSRSLFTQVWIHAVCPLVSTALWKHVDTACFHCGHRLCPLVSTLMWKLVKTSCIHCVYMLCPLVYTMIWTMVETSRFQLCEHAVASCIQFG